MWYRRIGRVKFVLDAFSWPCSSAGRMFESREFYWKLAVGIPRMRGCLSQSFNFPIHPGQPWALPRHDHVWTLTDQLARFNKNVRIGIDEMPCNEGMEANQARGWKQIKILQFLVQKITVCVRNDQMLEVNALGALEFKS